MPQVFATCLSAKGQRERPGGEAAREADEKSTSSPAIAVMAKLRTQNCPTRGRYTGTDRRIKSESNQINALDYVPRGTSPELPTASMLPCALPSVENAVELWSIALFAH